jgi:hypothetical protein
VILDVSGSATSTLLTVVKELEENYSSAAVVCVEGANIQQTGSKISYTFQQEEGGKYVRRLKNNLPVVEILSRFPVCYIPALLKSINRADLSLAIELLLEKNLADEIYIFSDFADQPHDPALIEELANKMLKKNIKLHILLLT